MGNVCMTSPSADGLISKMRSNGLARSRRSTWLDGIGNGACKRGFPLIAILRRRLCRSRARSHERQQSLDGRRDVMPQHGQFLAAFARDPVELNDATGADEWLMAVIG